MRESPKNFYHWIKRLIALVVILTAATRVFALIDANTNGMSDVWEQQRGAVGVDPNLDSDGDGFPNVMESLAGTDPFNANSYPVISGVTLSGTNFVMNLPSVPGKLYQLQSCQSLDTVPLAWTNETSAIG